MGSTDNNQNGPGGLKKRGQLKLQHQYKRINW